MGFFILSVKREFKNDFLQVTLRKVTLGFFNDFFVRLVPYLARIVALRHTYTHRLAFY